MYNKVNMRVIGKCQKKWKRQKKQSSFWTQAGEAEGGDGEGKIPELKLSKQQVY